MGAGNAVYGQLHSQVCQRTDDGKCSGTTNASESERSLDTESQTAASQEESTSKSESFSIQPDSASESSERFFRGYRKRENCIQTEGEFSSRTGGFRTGFSCTV